MGGANHSMDGGNLCMGGAIPGIGRANLILGGSKLGLDGANLLTGRNLHSMTAAVVNRDADKFNCTS